MRYGLRTLVALTAVGPPALAWAFADPKALGVACGWTFFVAFFALWYWMLHKSQSLDPSSRGTPDYELKHIPPSDT